MRRLVWLTMAVLALPLQAAATTIVALPESELIRHSQAIVVGTVIRTDAVARPGGRVATRVTLQVQRGLRGAQSNEVVILVVPGGRLGGGLVTSVPGAPVLRGGDMVLGFLERSGDVFHPLGLSYGLLRIRKDDAGELRVSRDIDGLAMVRPDGTPVVPASVALTDVPLDQMVLRIERQLRDLELPPPGTVTP